MNFQDLPLLALHTIAKALEPRDQQSLRQCNSSLHNVLNGSISCARLHSEDLDAFVARGWSKALKKLTVKPDATPWDSYDEFSNLESLKIWRSKARLLPESLSSLSALTALEITRCRVVASVPESIGLVASLRTLSFSGCESLASLPESLGKVRLESLCLDGCTSLRSLPGTSGQWTALTDLNLRCCSSLTSLDTLGMMTNMRSLDLGGCNFSALPRDIGKLSKLETLDLWRSEFLTRLPETAGGLRSLKTLRVTSCKVLETLPDSIGALPNLRELCMEWSTNLTMLPDGFCWLHTLDLTGCTRLEGVSFERMTSLKTLRINYCTSLTSLTSLECLAGSLRSLDASQCASLTTHTLRRLTSLRDLSVMGSGSLAGRPDFFSSVTHVHTVDISYCNDLTAFPRTLPNLSGLRRLCAHMCPLATLPKSMSRLTALTGLWLQCGSMTSLEPLGPLTHLEQLYLYGSDGIFERPEFTRDLGRLVGLTELRLSGHGHPQALPETLTGLKNLHVSDLTSQSIDGLIPKALASLQCVELGGCRSLTMLPELPQSLTRLLVVNCNSLASIACGDSVQHLRIAHCNALQTLALGRKTRTLFLVLCASLTTITDVHEECELEQVHISCDVPRLVLPDSMSTLTKLQDIYLYNDDTAVPPCLRRFAGFIPTH